jgi:Ser-tRNA(Ala) deacylase AlaX
MDKNKALQSHLDDAHHKIARLEDIKDDMKRQYRHKRQRTAAHLVLTEVPHARRRLDLLKNYGHLANVMVDLQNKNDDLHEDLQEANDVMENFIQTLDGSESQDEDADDATVVIEPNEVITIE